MQRSIVVLSLSLSATSWADSKPPKDAALIDRMFAAVEHHANGVHAVRGNCKKMAAVLTATVDADSKILDELTPKMTGPDSKPLEEYGKKKYQTKFALLHEQLNRDTLGCRDDKAFAAAWKHNPLMIASWGELPAEELTRKNVPKPADYEANVKKLDDALDELQDIANKLEGIDDVKECPARAKLVPAFGAAKKKADAAFDALDKKMQAAVVDDLGRSRRQSDPIITFMDARGRCMGNKAFVAAAKAIGLAPPK